MEVVKIPYAVANYSKLRSSDYAYIDKTEYIEKLENFQNPVFLRPRRFGKSLFCSMLRYYYDLNTKDRFDELFGDTYIGKNPTESQGKYMVLELNFSVVECSSVSSAEELEVNFNEVITPIIMGFVRTKYKKYFDGFKYSESISATTLFKNIVSYIEENSLPPMYIVIDEYDNFTNQLVTLSKDDVYMSILSADGFLKTFFKNIKEGEEKLAIANAFITGVLPITIDDLTSGFNVSKILTLNPRMVNMLGFTHAEAKYYLDLIYEKCAYDQSNKDEIWQLLVNNYDGYRFLPNAEPLFNSTILTYFFQDFVDGDGELPMELIDENLRTDVSWITRLALSNENAIANLEEILTSGCLSYSKNDLSSNFNKSQFTNKDFFPIALFYLGMVTTVDDYEMTLPNLTMKSIFTGYYNTLTEMRGSKDDYVPYFRQFSKDFKVDGLVECYCKHYLGQFVAQSFDKVNETFMRNTFYELCNRYLKGGFILGMEVNYPHGRADFEISGRQGTAFQKHRHIVELKYYPNKDYKKINSLTEPYAEHVKQVNAYASDAMEILNCYTIHRNVVYIIGNKGWRHWMIE